VRAAPGPLPAAREDRLDRDISGTKFRGLRNRSGPIPEWFSDPSAVANLREQLAPPLHMRGIALVFTGLPGDKTTIAHGLIQRLAGLMPTRCIAFQDGDVVRTHVPKVARIGWVAARQARLSVARRRVGRRLAGRARRAT